MVAWLYRYTAKKQVPRKSETTQIYLFTLHKVDLYVKFTDREQYNIH